MTLTLGKVTSIHLLICFSYSLQTNKRYITYKSHISHNHHIYHIYIIYLTKTINQTSHHIITNMFEHKHKYPTLKNISLKCLTKHYQHQTSSDRVISQSIINNTNKDNISSRWAAGLVWRCAGRSMRVIGCRPRLSLHREEIACVIPDEYISWRTRILLLTGVWNWARFYWNSMISYVGHLDFYT
jgi:hypothetical protein